MDAESRAEDAEDKVSDKSYFRIKYKKKYISGKKTFFSFCPGPTEQMIVIDRFFSLLLAIARRRSILSRFLFRAESFPDSLMSQADTSKEDLDRE